MTAKGRSAHAGFNKEDRYEQLLAAAAEAYAELGYHQASVKAIVERAGVATGTYYLYFANKTASGLAIIDRLYELVMDEVVRARKLHRRELDKLAASIEAVLRTFGAHPAMAKVVLIQAPGADVAFDRRLRAIHAELIGLVAQDLREAASGGEIPPQDERLVARCIVGSLYEILIGWIRDAEPADLEEAVRTVTAFNLRGIGAAFAAYRQA